MRSGEKSSPCWKEATGKEERVLALEVRSKADRHHPLRRHVLPCAVC